MARESRVGTTVVVSVHVPPVPTGPKTTEAVVEERSVPKFTMTWRPTRSVRYGALVRWASKATGVVTETAADRGEMRFATSRARTA